MRDFKENEVILQPQTNFIQVYWVVFSELLR